MSSWEPFIVVVVLGSQGTWEHNPIYYDAVWGHPLPASLSAAISVRGVLSPTGRCLSATCWYSQQLTHSADCVMWWWWRCSRG